MKTTFLTIPAIALILSGALVPTTNASMILHYDEDNSDLLATISESSLVILTRPVMRGPATEGRGLRPGSARSTIMEFIAGEGLVDPRDGSSAMEDPAFVRWVASGDGSHQPAALWESVFAQTPASLGIDERGFMQESHRHMTTGDVLKSFPNRAGRADGTILAFVTLGVLGSYGLVRRLQR